LPIFSKVTTDWRAVCGRSASTVRREGERELSLPLLEPSGEALGTGVQKR
jgi:hypothetical protein